MKLTDMPQLDALLSLKLRQAEELGIPVERLMVMPKVLPLPIVGLVSIIGNILDNAIEATGQLSEEQRFISLQAKPLGKMWRIRLTNSCSGQYRWDEGGTLISTKRGTRRGIGLRRITQLAEHNGGFVLTHAKETTFTIEVLLPWEMEDSVKNQDSS